MWAGVPAAAQSVFAAFVALDGKRSGTGFGALPIPYSEIAHYSALAGYRFAPWELAALTAMDQRAIKLMNKKNDGAEEKDVIHKEPMTPQLMKQLLSTPSKAKKKPRRHG